MQITGYHATNSYLSKLNYDKLLCHIDDHINGALGLWCASNSSWIKQFGKNIYEVTVDGNNYDMSIDELSQYACNYTSIKDYTLKRDQLIADRYDFIRIIETTGTCNIFVVLVFDKATICLINSTQHLPTEETNNT